MKEKFPVFRNDCKEVRTAFNVIANVFPHGHEFIITRCVVLCCVVVVVVGRVPRLNPALIRVTTKPD